MRPTRLLALFLGLTACAGNASVVGSLDAVAVDAPAAEAATDLPAAGDAAVKSDLPARDVSLPDLADITADLAGPSADTPVPDVPGRCRDNTDCGANEFGYRVCEVTTGVCVPCTPAQRGACRVGEYCTAANRCEAGCDEDADCARDGGSFRCDLGRNLCVGCVRDDQCPAGAVCGEGQTCVPGCTAMQACPTGEACCAGTCRRTDTDLNHCGVCGRACATSNGAPGCAAGRCTTAACGTGFGDCDGDPGNGCETGLGTALAHCGACGNACPARPNASANCTAGRCAFACAPGFADCDGDPANGCETDTRASVDHCGSCGNACAAGANASASCAAGRCGARCDAGFGDCDGNPANGCEADLQRDPTRCGTCTTACVGGTNARPLCTAGVCRLACLAGYADCDGNATTGCEAALEGTGSCGGCGNLCAGATPLCAPAGASFACSSGCVGTQTRCASACVDTQRAVTDCGGCGNACPAAANAARTCAGGRCGFACNEGYADCDGDAANGCEVFLGASVEHCGACRNACAAGANATPTCALGRCGLRCAAGFADCDGDPANGCEVDPRGSVEHCGVCGRACPGGANASPTCRLGVCGIACAANFADCDGNAANGCEAALPGDARHCGACGTVCASGVCTAGRCAAPTTCRTLLQALPSAPSGLYEIDPDGPGGSEALRVYCDMVTDGGGWTLVAYASRGSVGALNTDTGIRNLYSLATGGGSYDGLNRRGVASLAAAPIARVSREMLLARANADAFTGPIGGYDVATKFTIPNPAGVNFLNSNPAVNLADRGPCVPVTLTTVRGPDVTGATRYLYQNTLSVSWTDTYPTSYGVIDTSNCLNGSLGPNAASEYSGVGNSRSYPWPRGADGSSPTYWHLGWWDPTQTSRTGSVAIWLR